MGLPVLSDSLQDYLVKISAFPVLSREEEHEIAVRYYKYRNIEDAHRLVTSNLRYVVSIALEYRKYGCRLADLVQEGNIGLMTAVKKYNPFKGTRLITYANWWIRSFIQEYILRNRSLVRREVKALKKKLFYRAPLGEALPECAGGGCVDAADLSLDSPLGDDETTHLDMLVDRTPGQEDALAVREERSLVKGDVVKALAHLNDKERFVVERRVMAEKPESLQSLGETMGLTRERVRQIEGTALKKLKKRLAGKRSAA